MKRPSNDKGFSYVEMILVLGIMTIMLAMITISMGTIRRNNVLRTAEKMETLVNKARNTALTKGTANGVLNVAKIDNDVYAYVGTGISELNEGNINTFKVKGEKICSSDITIIINGVSTDSGSVAQIGFKQSTGGLDSTLDGTIMVLKGTRSSTFRIHYLTGKIYR